jgi:hypothetical protein
MSFGCGCGGGGGDGGKDQRAILEESPLNVSAASNPCVYDH